VLPEPLETLRQDIATQLDELSTYNDPRGSYMRIPVQIHID
jgi:protease-4